MTSTKKKTQATQRKKTTMMNATFVIMVSKLCNTQTNHNEKCCIDRGGFRMCNTQKNQDDKLHSSSWFQSLQHTKSQDY
jgi:hypothetical protein